jgi:eukaryotic-like serine/threonine-protein kinase
MSTHRSRGEVIGANYVLQHVLGQGGMGVVYAALQRSLDRVVAVKLLRPELLADNHARARLRTEAVAASRIVHRNSVRVLEYGEHGGEPYLVMEHIGGAPLSKVLEEHGGLPLGLAFTIVRQICSALEDAHAAGVIHADVKSANVLVETSRDGTIFPRLIDWGIARFMGDTSAFRSDSITGTPDYLPPEVMMGDPPTFAADTYAIGVMLYELVAGVTPFIATSRGAPAAIPLPLSAQCPQLVIPEELDRLVLRALSFDPAERFADASVLARALDQLSVVESQSESRSQAVFSTEGTTARMRALH